MMLNKSSEKIASMFDSIAHKYDFLNHFLSLGIDHYWRKKTTKIIKQTKPESVLDIATGTGDLAISIAKNCPTHITAIDFSQKMLNIAQKKINRHKLNNQIQLQQANALHLPFNDNQFDIITIGFGIRNFESLETGLKEMHRVLKPNGQLIILEFSKPTNPFINSIFNLYFKYILPLIGNTLSKNKNAYSYLFNSVNDFPCHNDFLSILSNNNFKETKKKNLTFGIATIYIGRK